MAYKLVRATAIKWYKILSYTGFNTIKQLPKYINGVELTKLNTKEQVLLKIKYKTYLIAKYT
jgi:hypothetical protein